MYAVGSIISENSNPYKKESTSKKTIQNHSVERVYQQYMENSKEYSVQRERARQGQEPDYSKIKSM